MERTQSPVARSVGKGRDNGPAPYFGLPPLPPQPHEQLASEVYDVVLWTAVAILLLGIAAAVLP